MAEAPFGRWHTQTFIATLRCDRLIAPWVVDGAMDGQGGFRDNFCEYSDCNYAGSDTGHDAVGWPKRGRKETVRVWGDSMIICW